METYILMKSLKIWLNTGTCGFYIIGFVEFDDGYFLFHFLDSLMDF